MRNHRLIKSASVIGSATLLSRILGFFRDMLIASYFGAGAVTDAFFVAFRIPNLLRRLLGEGALSHAFIPIFTQTYTDRGRKEALNLAGTMFNFLVLVLLATTAVGIIFAPAIVRTLTLSFSEPDANLQLTIELTRYIFPYIFFVALAALATGILNSFDNFFMPALSPVFLNVTLILSTVFLTSCFGERLDHKIFALAVGVLAGGCLQIMVQLPVLLKKGFRFVKSVYHPDISRIIKLMIPAVFGLAVTQLNLLVDTMLAWKLGAGAVSALYYGNRLVQLPLGVMGIALATAVLPTFSRQVAQNDWKSLRTTVSFSLRMTFFLIIPASTGLICLGLPLISLLFQRGQFDHQAALCTNIALFYYSIGLFAYSGIKILVPVFYALKDSATPVKVGIISMMLNVVLNLILMIPLRHGGLALATSIASIVNFGLLLLILEKKISKIDFLEIGGSFLRTGVTSFAMGAGVYYVSTLIAAKLNFQSFGHSVPTAARSIQVGVSMLLGIGAYCIISVVMQKRETQELIKAIIPPKNKITR